MSKLKVDQISKATGASPAIFTLPAADGTAGQYLKTDGSGILSWGTPPDQKITNASQWRLTADFTGDATPIGDSVGVIEEVDAPVGFGVLGDSMTESSGIFTFPSSGYYLIRFHAYFLANTNSLYNRIKIQTTTNDSTYAVACITSGAAGAANQEQGISTEYIFDVTDTTQCKCRFDVDVNAAGVTTKGDTDQNETFMTFIKLADT